jgi:hypothetical protein
MNKLSNEIEREISQKFADLGQLMDQRLTRLWAASEAKQLGYGGIACVSRATGINPNTIRAGIKELADPSLQAAPGRVRHSGAGRIRLVNKYSKLLSDLKDLVESSTRGDPMSPLLWTTKSVSKLRDELLNKGYSISMMSVWRLLVNDLGYTLQAPAKENEGIQHADRDKQFCHINLTAKDFINRNQPVVSVDAKKKELVGNYTNSGAEWQPKGTPLRTKTHDFPDPELGKVSPYGVYDIGANEGWVSVGITSDTAEFAVNCINAWWQNMGRYRYPEAKEIYITADAGGSNGYRNRLWKACLQKLADKLQLRIVVSHFPPGTSKWNKIEHRLFSEITKNWRGRPLLNYEVIINTIANTSTQSGLRVKARLDFTNYVNGISISDEDLMELELYRHHDNGDWNYWIEPRT